MKKTFQSFALFAAVEVIHFSAFIDERMCEILCKTFIQRKIIITRGVRIHTKGKTNKRNKGQFIFQLSIVSDHTTGKRERNIKKR